LFGTSTHSFGTRILLFGIPPSSFLFSKVWKFTPFPIIIELLVLFTYWTRTYEVCLFLFKTLQISDYHCFSINFYCTECESSDSCLSGKNDQRWCRQPEFG